MGKVGVVLIGMLIGMVGWGEVHGSCLISIATYVTLIGPVWGQLIYN